MDIVTVVFLCSRQSYSVISKIARCKTISYSWVFSRYLNSMNGRFSVFLQFFHECVCQKLSTALDSEFFKGLNFTNDQHPRNSWNLHTSKKPTIQWLFSPYLKHTVTMHVSVIRQNYNIIDL